MIKLTKLRGEAIAINCEQIEAIESSPDTIITLMNGHKYIVHEPLEEVIQKVIEYKQQINKPGL